MKKIILWCLLPLLALVPAAADELDSPVLKEAWRDEVLRSVNWDFPGLAAAEARYRAGDKKGASAEFVKYLRGKKQPQIFVDRLKKYDRRRASEGADYIWRYGANSHKFPNRKIDWFFNKTHQIPGMHDNEWQWQLNRMRWFADMAAAYRKTGDKKYVDAFVRQLRSWAVSCGEAPKGFANRSGSAWRGIESGLRLSVFWAPAYVGFINAPEFTDDDVMMFCYLGLIQSRHLKQFNTSGNIYVMEMNGIYTFGAMFPEFKESAAARQYAASGLYNNVNKMLLPDGFLNELTNSYHRGVIGDMLHVFRLARDCGLSAELPPGFVGMLERAYDALLRIMTPAMDAPLTNDSRHVSLWQFFGNAVKLFPERQDFLWVQSRRAKGKCPGYLSTVMPWSGFVILRESWDEDASYLCFDVGPLGMRHQHQDKLNIAIWKGQDQLLYDDGGGSYAKSKIRSYTRSSYAHNLVSVDGLCQATDSAGNRFRVLHKPLPEDVLVSDGKTDYTYGVFDQGWRRSGNKIVRQERQIVYLRPNIFIVLDRMIPVNRGKNKHHTYQARWHVDTLQVLPALKGHPALITTPKSSITARERGRKNRNRLIVAPLFIRGVKVKHAAGKLDGAYKEFQGVYAVHPYRVTTTITHDRSGKGEQRFLTMFITLGNKEANPLAKIVQNGNDGAVVTFKDGRQLEVEIRNGKLSAAYKNLK